MAEVEAEAFLLGHWKNFEELEETLNLDELYAVVAAKRKIQGEIEERAMEFYAAFKGVDLKQNKRASDEKFAEVEARAQARLAGLSPDEIEAKEFADLGIDFEVN